MKGSRVLIKTIFTAAVLVFASAAAFANTILVAPVNGNLYQQTVQSPCIFTNSSCQQGSFVGTPLDNGGSVTGYDATVSYTGSQILSIIGAGNALLLGLDINQASGQPAQTLTSFTMSINGVLADSTPGATSVPAGNNGNGYADYLLSNFSSFGANDTILFHFVFSNANDGTENVFLIGGPASSVPEPISVALTGSGLLGLLFLRKRFAKR